MLILKYIYIYIYTHICIYISLSLSLGSPWQAQDGSRDKPGCWHACRRAYECAHEVASHHSHISRHLLRYYTSQLDAY